MKIDDITIAKAISESFMKNFIEAMEVDVAIAGAGPASMTAAYYLATKGVKTAVFERQLRVGGGMPGGGMMFNCIVVQEEGKRLLDEFDVRTREEDKITGLVLNWSAVPLAGLHVAPLAIKAKVVIDATGHGSEICHIVVNKIGSKLRTKTGKVIGEKPMWAEMGEREIIENTKELLGFTKYNLLDTLIFCAFGIAGGLIGIGFVIVHGKYDSYDVRK